MVHEEQRILIVEDCPVTLPIMELQLNNQAKLKGISVHICHATTLAEATACIDAFSPSIISTDIQFPKKKDLPAERRSGIQFIQHCCKAVPNIPWIIYTGEENLDVLRKLLRLRNTPRAIRILEKEPQKMHTTWAREVLGLSIAQ